MSATCACHLQKGSAPLEVVEDDSLVSQLPSTNRFQLSRTYSSPAAGEHQQEAVTFLPVQGVSHTSQGKDVAHTGQVLDWTRETRSRLSHQDHDARVDLVHRVLGRVALEGVVRPEVRHAHLVQRVACERLRHQTTKKKTEKK